MNLTSDNPIKLLLRQIFTHSSVNKRNVKEVAPLLGVSERCVYQYTEPEKSQNIPPDSLAIISRYISLEYSDTRIAEHFLPEGSVIILPQAVECNGEIADKMVDANMVMGDFARAWKGRDYHLAQVLANKLAGMAGQLKAEAQMKTR